MGSRINIRLQELLCNPGITVVFASRRKAEEVSDTVEVTFDSPFKDVVSEFTYTFDFITYEGKVSLSMDYNYFRYSNTDTKHKLMRLLYEYSICFEIIH